ncbi:hypothetical protein [Vibrio barjaei]|uniref:hypothetical protein n=1 Tax=Vibrio barjaei TaxID=1676683 RepID=UPI0022841785|nr:hypothetical protein [Vibrio barjaei]MCY9874585.1 hypothetical protein [Vibrio barjaei]
MTKNNQLVQAINVTGHAGRRVKTATIQGLVINNGEQYELVQRGDLHFVLDKNGNEEMLSSKPFADANGCEFVLIDHSAANESAADFVIVGGKHYYLHEKN